MMLSLGQAAKVAGVGKTTIARAVSSGRLSATRNDDGSYAIDPAELSRVYDVQPERLEKVQKGETVETDDDDGREERDATLRIDAAEEARRQLATMVLEERVKALERLLEAERDRREAVERDRDRWHDQAKIATALLPPPPAPVAPAPANEAPETPRAGLLDRLFGRRVA
ncbi:hypothetical protein [Aureimonas psammosilenae]|uniref:hypothetical protein n=1 Tax=Aureimonas psammosilenae TaxID=2495496 RepID=UPI001260A33A|nr:hypothetical protein [Aureimonas psammosilenae]